MRRSIQNDQVYYFNPCYNKMGIHCKCLIDYDIELQKPMTAAIFPILLDYLFMGEIEVKRFMSKFINSRI